MESAALELGMRKVGALSVLGRDITINRANIWKGQANTVRLRALDATDLRNLDRARRNNILTE